MEGRGEQWSLYLISWDTSYAHQPPSSSELNHIHFAHLSKVKPLTFLLSSILEYRISPHNFSAVLGSLNSNPCSGSMPATDREDDS